MEHVMDFAFHSRPLRVGVITDGHYIMSHEQNGTEEITGFYIDLVNILAQSLNFSYELVLPADGEWGDEHDGQWTGLVGLLQRKEVDLAFYLAPSVQRSKVVQWTVPIKYWYNHIAVKTHDVQPDLLTAFLSPFHWSVYISILVSFVLCTCLLLFVTRVQGHLLPNGKEAFSPGKAWLYLYGAMLNRGMSWSATRGAGRALIAGWCLLGLLLTSGYTSKLTSLLVGVKPSPPFASVREMLAQNEYRWGAVGGTKVVQILRESNGSTEQALYKRMVTFAEDDPDVLSRDLDVHLSKVLSENYAFISTTSILDIWASEHCEITVLPVKLTGLEYYSIMLPKDSVITGEINDVLLRLHETGNLDFLGSRWFQSADHCHGNRSPEQTFSLTTLQGPFYAAAAGLLLAAGVLCTEGRGHRRDT